MNTHNTQNHLPEARGRGREMELEQRAIFARVVAAAWANTKQAFSATPDLHYAEGTVGHQAAAHSIVTTQIRPEATHTYEPVPAPAETAAPAARQEEAPVASANAAYIDALLDQPEPDALDLQEQARTEAVLRVIDAYREEQGLPQDIPPADTAAVPESQLTPMQQAEQQFPSDARYMIGDIDVSLGDIRDQVSGAFDTAPQQEDELV